MPLIIIVMLITNAVVCNSLVTWLQMFEATLYFLTFHVSVS